MKQVILALGVLLSGQLLAQNTFPANGNVGVGTTNPSARLDVNGHVKVDSTLIVKDSVIIQKKLTVDENAEVKGELFRIYHNALINESLIVDQNITAHNDIKADNKLTVDGVAKLNGIVKMMGLTEATQQFINSGNFNLLVTKQNGEVIEVPPTILGGLLGFEAPNPPIDDSSPEDPCDHYNSGILQAAGWAYNHNIKEIYTGCSISKVGIGTYHPEHKLDVKGTAKITEIISGKLQLGSRYYQNTISDALISGYEIGTNDIINLGTIINSGNQPLTNFKINNGGSVEIQAKPYEHPLVINHANGNMMFAITSTGTLILNNFASKAMVIKNSLGNKIFQLDDGGMLHAREIKVDEDNWPDYIFNENFTVLSLEDVAKYIKQHKHLPGVPSAETIKTDGLSVGKMQKILMQKIEELTLYTIEQNNQIQNLETKVNTLENENQQLKTELQQINDRLYQIEAKLNQ